VNIESIIRNRRAMKALIGMTYQPFMELCETFARVLESQSLKKERQRAPGGGVKGVLDTVEKKLFFTLFYLKVYPTFDVLGALFGKPRGRSCEAVHAWMPALEEALGQKCVLPQRQVRSVEEFRQRFPEVKDVMMDGTERPIRRPKGGKSQRRHYSGKKKGHRRKHLVVADGQRRILILTKGKPGRRHDKNLADRSDLAGVIPPEVGVIVDTGFQGVRHPNLFIPVKGSKKRPLSEEQKAGNACISSERIVVEHAIGGMKRYGVMTQPLRNKIGIFDDRTALVAAGLWNYHLAMAA